MEIFAGSGRIGGSVESLIGGRSENQDSYGMAQTEMGFLVVVCDGMGGGPAGKKASSLAVDAIIDYVSRQASTRQGGEVLSEAAFAAGEAVDNAVRLNPALKGMGTTCVCILFSDSKGYVMHIGDSRLYQLRGKKVEFRTSDHSYVGELVRRGALTEEAARTSQYSNVITRAIGAGVPINPEIDEIDILPGDRIALMSDGIWGAMPEENLIELLSAAGSTDQIVAQTCENVDAIGVEKGGRHDNLTLALCDVEKDAADITAASVSSADDEPANTQSDGSEGGIDAANDVDADGEPLPEYQLVEYDDDETELKRSRLPLILWCLAAVLVVSLAVNGYFIYKNSYSSDNEPKPVAADSTVAKTDSTQNAPDSTALAEQKQETEETPVTSSNTGYTPSYSSYSYSSYSYDDTNSDDGSEDSSSSSSEISETDRNAASQGIEEAITTLNRLAELNPRPGNNPKDKQGISKRRATFIDHAIDALNKSNQYVENASLRQKISNAISEISAAKDKTTNIRSIKDDGFSTNETKSELNELISMLRGIL